MDIQEKTLPASSVAVGDASEVIVEWYETLLWGGDGANGLTSGVAVEERDSTAKMREM